MLKDTFTLNGTEYIPKSLSVTRTDLRNQSTAENGDSITYIIRKNVLQISVNLELNKTNALSLKSMLDRYNNFNVSCRCLGETITCVAELDGGTSITVNHIHGDYQKYTVSFQLKEATR